MSAVIKIDFLEDNPDQFLQNINVNLEYTSKEVGQQFQANLLPFVTLFNGNVTPEDPTNREQMGQAINNLLSLAKIGIPNQPVIPNDPNSPLETKFLTIEMARDLELLLDTFKIAGIPFTPAAPVPITEDQARLWKSVAVQSPVARLISRAVDVSAAGNRTLQALLELEYIKTGSEVLADSLKDLEKALKTTKEALDVLEEIQVQHNRVEAQRKTEFGIDLSLDGTLQFDINPPAAEGDIYETRATDDFGTPLRAVFSVDTFNSVAGNVRGLRIRLETVVSQLEASGADASEGSLLSRLKAVIEDIPAGLRNDYTPFEVVSDPTAEILFNWLIDGYSNLDDTLSKGVFQDNITFAITAGQSLNDSQKEDVRRILFVFEEYYKSAAALLIKITQLVEKIAQGIAR